jgi:hypothetical protein
MIMAKIPTAEESATLLMAALVRELKLRPENALPPQMSITLAFERVSGNRSDLNVATWGYAVAQEWLRQDEEKDGALFLTAKGFEQG